MDRAYFNLMDAANITNRLAIQIARNSNYDPTLHIVASSALKEIFEAICRVNQELEKINSAQIREHRFTPKQ